MSIGRADYDKVPLPWKEEMLAVELGIRLWSDPIELEFLGS